MAKKKFDLLIESLSENLKQRTQETVTKVAADAEPIIAEGKKLKAFYVEEQEKFAQNQRSLDHRPIVESRLAFVDEGDRTPAQIRKHQVEVLSCVHEYNEKFNAETEILAKRRGEVPGWKARVDALNPADDVARDLAAEKDRAAREADALTNKQFKLVRLISLFTLIAAAVALFFLVESKLLAVLPALLIPVMFIVTTVIKKSIKGKRSAAVELTATTLGEEWVKQASEAYATATTAIAEAFDLDKEIALLEGIHKKSIQMFYNYYQTFLPERIIHGMLPTVIEQLFNGVSYGDALWRGDCVIEDLRRERLLHAHESVMQNGVLEIRNLVSVVCDLQAQSNEISVARLNEARKQTAIEEKQLAAQQAQTAATIAAASAQNATNRRLDSGVKVNATVDHYYHD